MRKRCCRRALQGKQPPDSWQTHVGRELIDQYVVPGYCEPITDLYTVRRLDRRDARRAWSSRRRGKASSTRFRLAFTAEMGSGTTNESWPTTASKSATRCRSTSSSPRPTRSRPLGFRPLALGNSKDTFPGAQTFENTLLGVVGPETYNALFQGETAWDDQGVQRRRRDLCQDARLRERGLLGPDVGATPSPSSSRAKPDSTAWATGPTARFVAKDAQDNIGWVSHPGTAGSFVLVVDSFTLPVGAPHRGKRQELAQDPRLEGSAGSVQSAEGLDPGANRCQPRPLLAISPVVDGQLRQ